MRKARLERQCDWPGCSCAASLRKWREKLIDEEGALPLPQLAWAEQDIFLSLCCMSKHCADLEQRIYAAGQLLDGSWDRQKALSVKGWQ